MLRMSDQVYRATCGNFKRNAPGAPDARPRRRLAGPQLSEIVAETGVIGPPVTGKPVSRRRLAAGNRGGDNHQDEEPLHRSFFAARRSELLVCARSRAVLAWNLGRPQPRADNPINSANCHANLKSMPQHMPLVVDCDGFRPPHRSNNNRLVNFLVHIFAQIALNIAAVVTHIELKARSFRTVSFNANACISQ